MPAKKLIFVDTNIWLDFYRGRNDAGLKLLKHLEALADKLVVTYQLEIEFKKNRQNVILEGIKELKAPDRIPRPAMFSDAQAVKAMNKGIQAAGDRVKKLKNKMKKVLENPATHDPVYQTCQRLFHSRNNLVLDRDNKKRQIIRRLALRRFLHGCPPRKNTDTSIGDAINWEWMLECAKQNNADLIIVSRDADYGIVLDDKAYVNDHLKQEFIERTNRRRKVILYHKLSEALKLFAIQVTEQEEEEEEIIISSIPAVAQKNEFDWTTIIQKWQEQLKSSSTELI